MAMIDDYDPMVRKQYCWDDRWVSDFTYLELLALLERLCSHPRR